MENLQQKVINWVKTLKGWQCELAYRLLIKEKLENSDIDEIVDMFRYTIKEMNANGIPQWDEIFTEEKKKVLYKEQKNAYKDKT